MGHSHAPTQVSLALAIIYVYRMTRFLDGDGTKSPACLQPDHPAHCRMSGQKVTRGWTVTVAARLLLAGPCLARARVPPLQPPSLPLPPPVVTPAAEVLQVCSLAAKVAMQSSHAIVSFDVHGSCVMAIRVERLARRHLCCAAAQFTAAQMAGRGLHTADSAESWPQGATDTAGAAAAPGGGVGAAAAGPPSAAPDAAAGAATCPSAGGQLPTGPAGSVAVAAESWNSGQCGTLTHEAEALELFNRAVERALAASDVERLPAVARASSWRAAAGWGARRWA